MCPLPAVPSSRARVHSSGMKAWSSLEAADRTAGRPEPPLLTPKLARALERERQDLVMSLRALASILREPQPARGPEEAVLARILDAQLVQLSVLSGDVIEALHLEEGAAGSKIPVDLGAAMESALGRGIRPVLVDRIERAHVMAHPQPVMQLLTSCIALAQRMAEGPVRVSIRRTGSSGSVEVEVPVVRRALPRALWEARILLLRRIARAEGGRLFVRSSPGALKVVISFPAINAMGNGHDAEQPPAVRSRRSGSFRLLQTGPDSGERALAPEDRQGFEERR